jgi:hypothetical protein
MCLSPKWYSMLENWINFKNLILKKYLIIFQMLFLQLFSSTNSSYLAAHNLDIIGILESIQSFDMYPYLIGQNAVCHKIFVNVLRLIIAMSTTTNQQIMNEVLSQSII